MTDPMSNPYDDPRSARIVDLAERRERRDLARDGLVLVDGHDAETTEPVELVEGVVIDPPDYRGDLPAWLANTSRAPVLPPWLTDAGQRRYMAGLAVRAVGYHVGVHAVRIPLYAALVAWYAPKGAARLARRGWVWSTAHASWGLRQDAANRNDPHTWIALDVHRERQASWRRIVGGAAAVLTGGAGAVLYSDLLPLTVRAPIAAGAVFGLARYGRPIDRPILTRTVVRPLYRRLTAELTRKGIMATNLVKRPEDVVFAHGDIRRDGPGYLAIVDLPDGVIATDVLDRREQLAGGLRLPLDQVWPEAMPREHPGCLALWVADRPVSAMTQPGWPLTRSGTSDYFEEFVYGFDPRMRPVGYRMDERNSLFAGFPGSGKSLSGRVVGAAMALDPLVKFVTFDLAGRGDFDMFEPLCAPGLFGSGADDGTKRAAYQALEWLLKECDTRGPKIKRLATSGLNTENKLNRAIAKADPSLGPIVAIFDEIQELITDPELGKSVAATLTSIVKRGRELGIHLILLTQRIDKESLPKGITSNIALRTCLAVPSHTEVDLALGTGVYRQGARPTAFEIGVDAGWGVRVGYGRMASVRAAYLDRKAVESICQRGVALRGGQVDIIDLPPARDLLVDLRNIWTAGETGQHWGVLADRLADRWPDAYVRINAETLSTMVRAHGGTSRNVKIGSAVRKGIYLRDITSLIDAREAVDDDLADVGVG